MALISQCRLPMIQFWIVFSSWVVFLIVHCEAWTTITRSQYPVLSPGITRIGSTHTATSLRAVGGLHGENSCFLPLRQHDQDYRAPRIVQIAGAYPGITREEFEAVQSEEGAIPGQWTYDFSDPDGPQVGTVALEGGAVVSECEDPVVIIGDHFSLNVPLPPALKDPVDLIVLVDRAKSGFVDRKFLVLQVPGQDELMIRSFSTKSEMSPGAKIVGHVELVEIPWLPAMKPSKSGFMEVDEYF
jgi:hypothetical protein